MSLGRKPNGLGMPRLRRRCAYISRFLASSSASWNVLEIHKEFHSSYFKYSARMIASKTAPRVKSNITIAGTLDRYVDRSGTLPYLQTGSVVLRRWLEILFKMTTSSSLWSGCSCWRTTLRNIERTAAKRPDYLEISYREIRERGKETYIDKGGVGHVVTPC